MLRSLRETLGMTQEEFAQKFGVSRNTVTRSETGVHRMRFTISQIKILIHLLKKAKIDLEDLPDEPSTQ